MAAFYNDFEPFCCGVLRRRIADGRLPYGVVDERPIQSIQPGDCVGCGQIHLFAGIGGFALAARLAGLPDDFSIITGGPPCQPHSVAGKQRGTADDRYLWPEMLRLIAGIRPKWAIIENVPALDGAREMVLDRVCSDLEAADYEVAPPLEIPAVSVNAPILRRRLWIVARAKGEPVGSAGQSRQYCHVGGANSDRCDGQEISSFQRQENLDIAWTGNVGLPERQGLALGENVGGNGGAQLTAIERASDYVGFWDGAEQMLCGDGKTRRIPKSKPGVQLMASRIPQRMARLKAIGNAICPQVAAEILRAIHQAELVHETL